MASDAPLPLTEAEETKVREWAEAVREYVPYAPGERFGEAIERPVLRLFATLDRERAARAEAEKALRMLVDEVNSYRTTGNREALIAVAEHGLRVLSESAENHNGNDICSACEQDWYEQQERQRKFDEQWGWIGKGER